MQLEYSTTIVPRPYGALAQDGEGAKDAEPQGLRWQGEAMNTVGVDVGGTKIAAGVVSPAGKLLSEVRYPTAKVRERLLSTIAEAITKVKEGYEVGGVCLAIPGFILARENKVLRAANLEAIEGVLLKEELGSRTSLPVTVENDANAAAWGEFCFGAGKDVDDLVFVTLGTGVGGGVISHGVLLRGARGTGGELGTSPSTPPAPAADAATEDASRLSPLAPP
jgi:glucokinase